MKKEIDLTDIAQKLDPTLEQNNADCDDDLDTEHPDFTHIDPGQITTELDNKKLETTGELRFPTMKN